MKISKIKAGWSLLTGGIEGLVGYLLGLFNTQVLANASAEQMKKYCLDVIAIASCLKTILDNHASDMSEAKKAALEKTIEAVNALADALSDANVTKEELDKVVASLKNAIKAWKEAK